MATEITESDRVRFWAKVDRNGPTLPGMQTPCWLWTAGTFPGGYGQFRVGRKTHRAQRIAFLLAGGVFTDSKPQANHQCRNPPCCNPSHIYAGDHQQSMDDMVRDGTAARVRGDANGARTRPEKRPRGDANGMRTHPEKRPRGEKNGNVKLTDKQCAYIRSSSLSQPAIARELGVSQQHISRIRNKKYRNT